MRWFSEMSAMAAHKFTFSDDFGLERRDGIMRRAQDRAALEEAEQRGYAAGFAAGQSAQIASDEAQLAHSLHLIASTIEQFVADRDRFFEHCQQTSVSLAHHLVTLHGAIVSDYDPLAAFSAAAREIFLNYAQAVRIVARVPVDIRDATEVRMKKLAADLNYSGALSVEVLPAGHGAADFMLEWPEGALQFDRAALQARLANEFQRCGFSMTDVSDSDD